MSTRINQTLTLKARTEFTTREKSKKEQVLVQLYARKGKAVSLDAVTKTVYGKVNHANRIKVKMTVLGINVAIKRDKLAYKPVTYTGRGAEATFGLFGKSRKAA